MTGTLLPDPELFEFLEGIYETLNRRERLCRDPLALVVPYADPADREVAGLVCSTLAFGAVDLILRACEKALTPLGAHPAATLAAMNEEDMLNAWGDFQYRFCFPNDLIGLMRAMKGARERFGSLEALLASGDSPELPLTAALSVFVRTLRALSSETSSGDARTPIRLNLLPDPESGSACKRLFLYLRWMIRSDDVDPGGWSSISPARLIVPMDTHMAATCRVRLGFLASTGAKRQPNLKDALAVTSNFTRYSPGDPVKYDFALTRPGIDPRPGDEIYGCR
jgi:uncharacterized protein (TIGR02757 family)